MRKLFIVIGIVFLMIFTAVLASAALSPFPFISDAGEGTLFFVDGTGAVTSDSQATISVTQATTTATDPTNLFFGTLLLTPNANFAAPLSFALSILRPSGSVSGGVYQISGVDSTNAYVLTATGTFARLKDTFDSPAIKEWSINMTGTITTLNSPSTTFSFEGRLFQ
jgi:hypothetical protein